MSINCPGGTVYIIKGGDTLYTIAARYNTTVSAIISANPGINPNYLRIGQEICIPVAPPVTCPGGTLYTIKAGDTLYTIAGRYNTTVTEILRANPGINPNALRIGQVICIPVPPPITCPGGTLYTIKAGDTLYTIAQRYNTTVGDILLANPGLNPNALRIGQVICVPQGPPQPVPRPRCVILNPTDLVPNSKGMAFIEPDLGSVVALVTNVPDPTVFPGGFEVYKLWINRSGVPTPYAVTIMEEVFPDYWIGRLIPGFPLTGANLLISAEKRANTTVPEGMGVAVGTL